MEAGWFEILLHLDIITISNIYYINYLSYNLCKDKHFWITKFNYDSINIMDIKDTIGDWIKEYNLIKNLILQARDEVFNIYICLDVYEILLDEFNTYTSIPFLPHKIMKIINKRDKPKYLSLNNIITGNIILTYGFTNDDINDTLSVDISLEELDNMIFNIYYYEYTQKKKLRLNIV